MSFRHLMPLPWDFYPWIPSPWRPQVVKRRHGAIWNSISAESEYLLIHIPKTGGTTLAESLYGHPINHYPVWVWRDADPDRFRKVTTFAVMRDPCERLVSSVRHCLGSPRASIADLSAGQLLKQAGASVIDMCFAYLTDRRLRRRLQRVILFRPQTLWITDDDCCAVDVLFALRTRESSDPPRLDSGWRNVNQFAPKVDAISPELRSLANKFYHNDRVTLDTATDHWIDDVCEAIPILASIEREEP